MKIAWQFPTHVEKAGEAGKTTAVQARHALSLKDAIAEIAGDDQRPLLVLRECLKCNGTDDALMTRNQDNERTLMMSRWFHCVKLPPDVLDEDHPYHELFAQEKPGHLFLARFDGSQRQDLTGQQSRTELWSLMESYLSSEYEKKADGSVKALIALLDRFDRIDSDIATVKEQMDDLIEKGQADSSKMKKLGDKLSDLEAAKRRARADAVKLSDLKLKQTETPAKPAGESAEVPPAPGPGRG